MPTLFSIGVATNSGEVSRALTHLAQDQLPFATAAALTATVNLARDEIRAAMPRHFTIRSKRVVSGVTTERAEKRDWPNPRAKVGTRDDFMALQALGGEKTPGGGGFGGASSIAIPTRIVAGQRTGAGAIPARLKPRVLRDRPDVYLADDDGGSRAINARLANDGQKGAADRTKKGAATAYWNERGFESPRLFTLVKRAEIPKRWPFVKEAEDSARRAYPALFEKHLAAAVKSARVRVGSFSSGGGRAHYQRALNVLG